jgi:hypothetical protein
MTAAQLRAARDLPAVEPIAGNNPGAAGGRSGRLTPGTRA